MAAPLANEKLICYSRQRHIFRNSSMWNQRVIPWLAIITHGIVCSMSTPLHRGIFFGFYFSVIHIATCFHLKHINAVGHLRDKVRLILLVIAIPMVKNLELALGRSEPF